MVGACVFKNLCEKSLPDAKGMLHKKADRRNGNPTAKTHKNGFSAGFYKLDNIGVQTDCRHRHNNQKFRQLFKRLKESSTDAGGYTDCCNHRGKNKKQNKKGEYLF